MRVVGVYAPASRSGGNKVERKLLEELRSQFALGRKSRAQMVVLGDFNESPPGDRRFNNTPSRYPQASSLIKRLELWGMIDGFRNKHPDTHGPTFSRPGCLPSRIDSIWLPKNWSHLGLEASVNSSRSVIPHADHCLVTVALSFRGTFGCPSKEVRADARRAVVEVLDTAFLENPKEFGEFSRGTHGGPEGKRGATGPEEALPLLLRERAQRPRPRGPFS